MKSAAIGLTAATGLAALASSAIAQEKKPNIIVIMGDDVGWENIGAYHQGLMYDTTPNLDKLAGEGMRFTDYYAEPSCTAGRANFITGELPIRTGLTTVGQAGAKVGMPDVCGGVMAKLKADGLDDNTIVVFTTDNGAENFTWPDGGNTPFAAGKGTIMEGGMRVPMIARWPGHIPAGKVENGIFSGLDFFPTFAAIAGDANIKQELLTGKQLGDKTFKVHLDGYDQTNVLTGKGPSNRHEIFYFAEGTLGAVRLDDWKFRMIDQPNGWLAGTVKLDWPTLSNLRLDPFERMQFQKGNEGSFEYVSGFYIHEFWRFVFLQQKVGEYAQTFVDFPPMQRGASFNLEAVKAEIEARVKAMKAPME